MRFNYQARIQFTGTFKLLCPKCGNVNVYPIRAGVWKIRCKYQQCRKFWVFQVNLASPSNCPGAADLTPPDTIFPVVECSGTHWPGENVITVSDDNEST